MMELTEFETTSIRMMRQFRVTVQAPVEDVERIMAAVTKIAPLAMGKYDSNAYQTAAGVEHYRPREGAVAGIEEDVRKRPGVCEISFQLGPDQDILQAVVETIYQVHSYQEMAIMVQPMLASRTKGLDDSKNPNRWWNTTGDWKKNV